MAGTTATPITGGTPARGTPASRGAAQRVQRYYNKASGRMETAQAMHAFHPQGHAQTPPPHQVSKTTSTTRTSTANARPAPTFNLLTATPAQIEARAKAITSAELAGERLPFQQRDTQLGQERTGAVAGVNTAYAGLSASVAAQGTSQAASAKTLNNEAADRLAKTEAANPKATAGMSESERNRAEADRTLLTGLATSAQTGTATRQEAEANFLKNLQGITALKGQGAAEGVSNTFNREKQENANRQSQAEARAGGRTGKFMDTLEAEQAKLRFIGAGLGLKEGALRVNEAKEVTTAQNQRAQRQGEQQKISLTAQQNKEHDRLVERGQNLTRASAAERNAASREHTQVYAEIKRATGNGTKPTRAAGLKYQGLIDTAYGFASKMKEEGKSVQETEANMQIGEGTGKGGEAGVGYSPDVIRAAINLVKYGRLGPNDQKVAAGYGLTPQLGHPEWFRSPPSSPRGTGHGVLVNGKQPARRGRR